MRGGDGCCDVVRRTRTCISNAWQAAQLDRVAETNAHTTTNALQAALPTRSFGSWKHTVYLKFEFVSKPIHD